MPSTGYRSAICSRTRTQPPDSPARTSTQRRWQPWPPTWPRPAKRPPSPSASARPPMARRSSISSMASGAGERRRSPAYPSCWPSSTATRRTQARPRRAVSSAKSPTTSSSRPTANGTGHASVGGCPSPRTACASPTSPQSWSGAASRARAAPSSPPSSPCTACPSGQSTWCAMAGSPSPTANTSSHTSSGWK